VKTETFLELAARLKKLEKDAIGPCKGSGLDERDAWIKAAWEASSRLIQATDIASRLAGMMAPTFRIFCGPTADNFTICALCGTKAKTSSELEDPANHPPDCIWRMSVEADKGEK